MRIKLVGMNHQTAPVAVREKAAISPQRLREALLALKTRLRRGVILSTCNRTEIYTIEQENRAEEASREFFKARLGVSDAELDRHVFRLQDAAAVERLFRIASGLESMIIGEYEVLGQVSRALQTAEKAGMVHLPLRHIFQSAVRTGRRVREETGISLNALSVSSVAVALAAGAVGELASRKMLVIGTGEAGRLVARAARERGISRTVVAGHNLARARALAEEMEGRLITTDGLDEELANANVVVSCSGAPHYTLSLGQVRRAMKRRPELPLIIIDIAVPRNIEPAVSRLDNVFLYNIDDITGLSGENLKQRRNEIGRAESIVAEELASFRAGWQELEVRPLIKAMMGQAEEIRRSQLDRTLKKLPGLTEAEKHRLEMMTKAIVGKVLQDPIINLKAGGDNGHDYTETIKQLFRLEVKDYR